MENKVYQSFIGLEVHIHLLTRTKVFCGCRSAFGDEPNTNVCPVCMGYPGVLPSLNIEAMRMGCTVARALNCGIPEKTWFERKQYFYPDMTKNYQISQFASPLGQNGSVEIEGTASGKPFKKTVRIKECHLEEDAGKMIHTGTVSLLDYNRAGVSLLEIVTEPDMETGEEAEVFIQQLRRMVRYLGVCDGNMEEGSLRADANVSINFPGKGLGRKVEIKNLNSSRFVRMGLNYEIGRQGELLDEGKTVVQETRLWNENRDQTEPMRKKENAHDYRYFPEPDLPVFTPDPAFLNAVETALVELPVNRVKRFEADYGLTPEQAGLICEEKEAADYFEAAVAVAALDKKDAAARVANLFLTDIKRLLHREGLPLAALKTFTLTPKRLASLAVLTATGRVSTKNAKQALEAAVAGDKDPEEIIKEKGWELLNDPAKIAEAVKAVKEAETGAFAELSAFVKARAVDNPKRRRTLMAFLVGKVLAATGGRADPAIAQRQIEESINEAV
jgi:aspartyl-tRNA(Asn)/glutamyl-tRNA(Gln) amidotransferase subunit B